MVARWVRHAGTRRPLVDEEIDEHFIIGLQIKAIEAPRLRPERMALKNWLESGRELGEEEKTVVEKCICA